MVLCEEQLFDQPSFSKKELVDYILISGPQFLTDAQLLSLVSGVKVGEGLVREAQGLYTVATTPAVELAKMPGITREKAARLKAAVELGRRLSMQGRKITTIKTPQDIADLVMENMRFFDREYFQAAYLDCKNHVISIETISIGGLHSSIVHPREVFKGALLKSAAGVILIHNHPTGDPSPSQEDIEVTKRLVQAGQIMGIEVLDHIIIGDRRYFSMKGEGLI